MTACISPAVFGADAWKADAYEAVSISYRITVGAIQTHLATINIATRLWKLDGLIRGVLAGFYERAEHPDPNQIPPTPEQIKDAITALRKLHSAVHDMTVRLRVGGFDNRRLIAPSLSAVRIHADEVLDIAECVELSLDPDIDGIFDKSLDDLRDGRTFDLKSIG
jgi:hypothetical protein